MRQSRIAIVIAVASIAAGFVFARGLSANSTRKFEPSPPKSALGVEPPASFGQPQIGAVAGKLDVLKDIRVVDFGREVYRGEMDLNPTIDRIRRGEKLNHRNDGAFFGNRERLLPRQNDREYYREFVHTLHSPKFPGPQRVVIGKDGSVWYTGDHYDSFTKVTK